MPRTGYRSWLALLFALAMQAPSSATPVPGNIAAGPVWCPPNGPGLRRELPELLAEGQYPFFKPGWALISMRVRPGAVPVTEVRVVSEAGSDSLARTWLPLVRQWVGCASNERDTYYQVRFTYGVQGVPDFPTKEAFSLKAFKEPRGAPELPAGDWGIGICPIKATVILHQPKALNEVLEIEGRAREAVRDWLSRVVPDREYMVPNPLGNRVEFDCRVRDGRVYFTVQ